MNKTELIEKVSQKTGLTKKDTEASLNAILDTITEALVNDDKVLLVGFGSFETKKRAERVARNPRTNAPVTIPATKVCQFKAGKKLKDTVASGK